MPVFRSPSNRGMSSSGRPRSEVSSMQRHYNNMGRYKVCNTDLCKLLFIPCKILTFFCKEKRGFKNDFDQNTNSLKEYL